MSGWGIDARGRSFAGALANADVRRALQSQAVSTTTQYLITTALAIHLVKSLGASSLWLLSLRYVPAALVGPLSAVPTDRFGPRRALLVLFSARATVIGAAAFSLAAGLPVGIVVALTVVEAGLGTACLPAAATVQVAVARTPAELSAASAMTSNAKSVCEILGGVLGGFLSAVLAPQLVFAAAATVALTGAASALGMRATGTVRHSAPTRGLRATFMRDWSMIRDRAIAPTTALAAARASNRAVWVGLSVIAATGFLKMGTAGVGALVLAAGVGTAVSVPAGMTLVGRERLGSLLAFTIAAMGIPLVLIAVLGTELAALVLISVWGLSGAVADMSVGALIPRVAHGRVATVVSINEMARNAAQALATLLVPVSVTVFGARSAVALWGAIQIVEAAFAKRGLSRVDVDVAAHMRIIERLRSIELFRPLRVVELEQVAGSLVERPTRSGEVVVREREPDGRTMYVIDSGTVEITLRGEPVAELAPGDSFGEIALLHRIPRTATAIATSDGTLFELDRESFIRAVSDYQAGEEALGLSRPPADRPVELGDALRSLPILSELDDERRSALAAAAIVRTAEPGELLCAEGDVASALFLMLDGTADVLYGDQVVGTVGSGHAFGEIGLLHQIKRTATIRAHDRSTIAELSREALTAAIGHAPSVAELSPRRR